MKTHREAASFWTSARQVWIGSDEAGVLYDIESSRAYRDRWVLKLREVDDPSRAAQLKGEPVAVPRSAAPPPPAEGAHVEELLGFAFFTGQRRVGTVRDVFRAPAGYLLEVLPAAPGAEPVLVPWVASWVLRLDPDARTLSMELPEGLIEDEGPR